MTTESNLKKGSINLVRIGIFVAIALALLWVAGIFKSNPKVALITSGEGPYWDLVVAGAKVAAQDNDATLEIIRCKSDADAQLEAIRQVASGRFAGVGVSPIDPVRESSALVTLAGQTTLITFDSDAPVTGRLCFVGTDNYGAGRIAGDQVRRAISDGGEILICVGNFDKENTQRRRQGVIDEILERPYEPSYPTDAVDAVLKGENYSIVATLVDHSDPNQTVELVNQALKDHPQVKCIVGLLGYSTPAILKALENAGRTGQIQVVGFDNADATLAGIEKGYVYSSILQDQFGIGYQTVRILAENARGNRVGMPLFGRQTLPCEIVMKDNVVAIRAKLSGRHPAATHGS